MEDYFESPLTRGAEPFFKKIQSLLKYCPICQPYDGGEYIWIFGERINLQELLEGNRVPVKYRDEIYSHLVCPKCGNDSFDESSDIGLEDKNDAEVLDHLAIAEKKYKSKIIEFGHKKKHRQNTCALTFPGQKRSGAYPQAKAGLWLLLSAETDKKRSRDQEKD